MTDIQNTGDFGISRSPCIGTGEAVKLMGELDDFRIYERALSAEEIMEAFNELFADGFEDL